MPENVFVSGTYVEKVPQWHTDDSPWKAKEILRLLARNHLCPLRIGEVGCGTGEVLRQLQLQMNPQCEFVGYDIAPAAIALSQSRKNERLRCTLGDIRKDSDAHFDLLLVLDVLEHQENYFSFLRELKPLAPYKLIHIVLDLSVHALLRENGLTKQRDLYHDFHYFTKDMVLQTLAGEDYEVIDWCYVSRAMHRTSGVADKVRQLPRVICFALHSDFAVRLLGGYSLLVLAK